MRSLLRILVGSTLLLTGLLLTLPAAFARAEDRPTVDPGQEVIEELLASHQVRETQETTAPVPAPKRETKPAAPPASGKRLPPPPPMPDLPAAPPVERRTPAPRPNPATRTAAPVRPAAPAPVPDEPAPIETPVIPPAAANPRGNDSHGAAARAVVDELAQPAPAPAAPPTPPVEKPVARTTKRTIARPDDAIRDPVRVVDSLVENDADRIARQRKDGLLYFQQAKAAEKIGKLSEALRLARLAKKLYPENAEIGSYTLALQKEIASNRLVSSSNGRAKAHVAAALTRGIDLMRVARYRDGEDLLSGIVQATQLFPNPAEVDMYRRLADRELERYHAAVKAGRIAPDPRPTKEVTHEAKLVATSAAAPDNLRRLLRGSEPEVPAWYAGHKNRLAMNMTVNYRNMPVGLVFDDISAATGVPIVVDTPVAQARAHVNAMVDLRIAEVPAETILNLACLKAGLEYVIMERSVVITTPARALDYVRQLQDTLRYNWAVGRVLFPELNPELFAAPASTPTVVAGPIVQEQREMDENVPVYLRSGKALVAHIRELLR